jgi:diketogulonate reductase-like aldo/keto reductase
MKLHSRQVPDGTGALVPLNPDGTRKVDWNWEQSKTWKQMEELYRSGKAKAIGVSNWSIPYLEDLSKHWSVIPAVNQVSKSCRFISNYIRIISPTSSHNCGGYLTYLANFCENPTG